MYTLRFNKVEDRQALLEAMRRYSFAILFGGAGGNEAAPMATHLPLIVRDEGEHGVLLGHFAKANPHWRLLAGRETLVVFPGPHSYVSPSLYTEALSVPTWNYIAIHAYGTLEVFEEDAMKNELVEELVGIHEPAFLERWLTMSGNYRRDMLGGIVGFRIPIVRIEGKFKLSQNRAAEERRNVYETQAAGSDDERELARWMQRMIPGLETKETETESENA